MRFRTQIRTQGRRQKAERRRISWKGDGSPENEASRGRETDRRGREISASEVGQQGGVARRCSRAASHGVAAGRRRTALQQGGVAGSGDARRGVARQTSASQVSFAGRRRKALQQGDVAGSGGAREGVARQLSPL